jgi:hypothetical protein
MVLVLSGFSFLDSIGTQCLGRASAALIQRGNETRLGLHFLKLLSKVANSGLRSLSN